ncbi:hypothetical protein PAXRUDRAFT_764786 [Paxillus rubicundulus Ve08.2h10]|uniref:Uncharacterized protein n=1 Tax=Paxillus rubicundulus Ve08.2h10 TaxID=930991 RepID=A0A0D0DP92_9AGAM|nr:hypothetical protein PAXRUDRAFT_764786 [Paxillus rubicundulus Ve08.2h10]
MLTTVPITTNTLPSNVPKLDIKGANWAIFSLCFQVAVKAKELWKQFDRTEPHPVGINVTAPDGSPLILPLDPVTLAKWLKSENIVKHLLTQCIPNSTVLCVRNLASVAAMWKEIMCEVTSTKFLESLCPTNGDVCQSWDDLYMKCNELAAVGID